MWVMLLRSARSWNSCLHGTTVYSFYYVILDVVIKDKNSCRHRQITSHHNSEIGQMHIQCALRCAANAQFFFLFRWMCDVHIRGTWIWICIIYLFYSLLLFWRKWRALVYRKTMLSVCPFTNICWKKLLYGVCDSIYGRRRVVGKGLQYISKQYLPHSMYRHIFTNKLNTQLNNDKKNDSDTKRREKKAPFFLII